MITKNTFQRVLGAIGEHFQLENEQDIAKSLQEKGYIIVVRDLSKTSFYEKYDVYQSFNISSLKRVHVCKDGLVTALQG